MSVLAWPCPGWSFGATFRKLLLEQRLLLGQGGAWRPVDVGEELHRVDGRFNVHGVACGRSEVLSFSGDRIAVFLAEDLFREEVLLQSFDRVPALPRVDLLLPAVPRRVVGVGVRLDAVGEAFDDARAAP